MTGRVIVTGGAGYFGSHVTRRLLSSGYRVGVLDALLFGNGLNDFNGVANLEVVRGDTRSIADLSRLLRGVDCEIHLAAIVGDAACSVDPDVTWTTNLEATKLIVDACRHYGVKRLIFASTCSVYGASDDLLLNEGSLCRPLSLYAQTRLESERICLDAASPDLVVTCLRMATLFGLSPRMRFDLVVNIMTARGNAERVVTVFGGEQWRPLVHVADAADAFVAALEAPEEIANAQIFNVGSNEQNLQILEVGRRVAAVCGARVQLQAPSLEDRRNYRVSFDKIARLLSFEARRTIESGAAEIVQHLSVHPEMDYLHDRHHNHRFPYAIDPAILPSHRPRLRASDDAELSRAVNGVSA